MALRVVSGVILTSSPFEGKATVVFASHAMTGDVKPPAPQTQRSIGPGKAFLEPPCFIVAPREFIMHETADRLGLSHLTTSLPELDQFIIDTTCTRDFLEVRWACRDFIANSRSSMVEISYLVMGEA